jgi:hypothetical protein
MEEKWFIIREWNGGPMGWTITETELLRRIYLIRTRIETGQSLPYLNERAIDILIYGEQNGTKDK